MQNQKVNTDKQQARLDILAEKLMDDKAMKSCVSSAY